VGKERVVIVGGGGAGDSAAFGLREFGYEGEIVLVSADTDRPYDRPYLSKEFLRGEIEATEVFLRDEAAYSANKIELRLGRRVTGGSLALRRVTLDDGAELAYDSLILATGGTPRWLPGVPQSENVHTLRSLADGHVLRGAIGESTRLLLIGAGFIGAEVGASARLLGKDVLMVEAAPMPLARALGEEVGKVYAAIHTAHGVDLRTGTTVAEWHTAAGRVTAVTLSDGSQEEVDLVVLGAGIESNLELPVALGLPTEGGGVVTDEGLRAVEAVYVAGDIAFHRHPVLGRQIRVEHWEVAKGQGTAVARSLAQGHVPYKDLPYFWSDQYEVSLEYRGQASGEHDLVWRGDRDALRFSVFYMREGHLDAVLSINDGATNQAAERLIQERRPIDTAVLTDTAFDLATLAVTPVEGGGGDGLA
jgi:3-phenylpropionate/trans-cinnamate dioxygenase ferredoxin reductase component